MTEEQNILFKTPCSEGKWASEEQQCLLDSPEQQTVNCQFSGLQTGLSSNWEASDQCAGGVSVHVVTAEDATVVREKMQHEHQKKKKPEVEFTSC